MIPLGLNFPLSGPDDGPEAPLLEVQRSLAVNPFRRLQH